MFAASATARPCRLIRLRSWLLASIVAAGIGFGCGGEDPIEGSAFQSIIAGVPVAIAPVIAASDDDTIWMVWTEGDFTTQSLAAAHVDAQGHVVRSTLAPPVAGSLQGERIVMVGTTPLVAWREYDLSGDFSLHVASYARGRWAEELKEGPTVQGDVALIDMPNGGASLAWLQAGPAGEPQIMWSARSPEGSWTAPAVIARLPTGTAVSASRQATDPQGNVMVVWSEAPTGPPTPQTLHAARLNAVASTWSAPAEVDGSGYLVAFDVASWGDSRWVMLWVRGNASIPDSLVAKRFSDGAWDSTASRIDSGDDPNVHEFALAARHGRVYVAWTVVGAQFFDSAVRTARFDATTASWDPPVGVAAVHGLPLGPRAAINHRETAVAWWVDQGTSPTPSLSRRDGPAMPLDPDAIGMFADVALFSSGDVAASWLRACNGQACDIVVRRFR